MHPITYIRVRNRPTALVSAVKKPQFTVWHHSKNDVMKLLHVISLWLWLSCDMVFDLVVYVHMEISAWSPARRIRAPNDQYRSSEVIHGLPASPPRTAGAADGE